MFDEKLPTFPLITCRMSFYYDSFSNPHPFWLLAIEAPMLYFMFKNRLLVVFYVEFVTMIFSWFIMFEFLISLSYVCMFLYGC